MPRGDKSKYTDKQKRQAEHIEEGYKVRGVGGAAAAARPAKARSASAKKAARTRARRKAARGKGS